MTDRRCATCRHWKPPTCNLSRSGECSAIETELFAKPEPMAAMCADPPAGCTLFTLPEFGCELHEDKP